MVQAKGHWCYARTTRSSFLQYGRRQNGEILPKGLRSVQEEIFVRFLSYTLGGIGIMCRSNPM